MSRSLVIGASGLIGGYLTRVLGETGQVPSGTYFSYPVAGATKFDMRQQVQVEKLLLELRPNTIYLPAALPNVDYCQTHANESYEINVRGVKHVVDACNQVDAKVIYFSTDYIFDGKSGPYGELEVANPLSVYGEHKVAAEHYIALHAQQYLIIRTTIVYGWELQGKNFLYRLMKFLRAGETIRVPMDQYGTPTYAGDLAGSAVRLSSVCENQVINIAGPDWINRYEFAVEIAKIFDLPAQLIQPVFTTELNQLAPRPRLAGLQTERAAALLGSPLMSVQNGLQTMRDQQQFIQH